MKPIYCILSLIFLSSCYKLSYVTHRINEKCAVRNAEKFIQKNGYAIILLDTASQYYHEFFYDGFANNQKEIVDKRYNSLYPEAYFVKYDKLEKYWIVGFIGTKLDIQKINCIPIDTLQRWGRTVIIDPVYHGIKISHITHSLQMLKKLYD